MIYQDETGMNYRGWRIQFNNGDTERSYTAYDPDNATAGYWIRATIIECKAIIDAEID